MRSITHVKQVKWITVVGRCTPVCAFKEVLVSATFPPVHSGNEAIEPSHNYTVRDGWQNAHHSSANMKSQYLDLAKSSDCHPKSAFLVRNCCISELIEVTVIEVFQTQLHLFCHIFMIYFFSFWLTPGGHIFECYNLDLRTVKGLTDFQINEGLAFASFVSQEWFFNFHGVHSAGFKEAVSCCSITVPSAWLLVPILGCFCF